VSKRFWIPTRKGSDFSTRTYQQPTKLVIRGVPPDTPLYHIALRAFSGRLKQFHAKQQRAYSLSENQIHKGRVDWGAARATYTNIHGQEILELEVDVSVLAKMQSTIQDFWDYALIEIYVPDMHYIDGAVQLVCYAHVAAPLQAELTPLSTLPTNGVAASHIISAAPTDRLINAPKTPGIVRTTTPASPTEAYASFTLDLQPLRGGAAKVDLYPYIRVREEQPPVTTVYTPDSNEWSSFPTRPDLTPPEDHYNLVMVDDPAQMNNFSYAGVTGQFAFVFTETAAGATSGFTDYTGQTLNKSFPGEGTLTWSLLPERYFDRADLTWKFTASSSPIYNEELGELLEFDGTVDPGPMYRHWWVSTGDTSSYVAPYDGPDRAYAEVQVTLFKGQPETDVTRHTATVSYLRWTFPAALPNRPGASVVARTSVPAMTDDELASSLLSEFYSIPKLGSVGIDTWRIRPEHPGVITGPWWQQP
jgi:hypothetical protein